MSVEIDQLLCLPEPLTPAKGFFVQQTDHAVLAGDLLQQLHGQLVVVGGNIGGRENRRKLMLRGGDLIVLGLGQNAELPELLVQILHERGHARLDGAEIMVVQLLPLRRLRAEERAARVEAGPCAYCKAPRR